MFSCGSFLSLLNLLQYCFRFIFWFLVWKHVESLLPNQGLNLQPPVLEGEVLTTRPPGKSLFYPKFFDMWV